MDKTPRTGRDRMRGIKVQGFGFKVSFFEGSKTAGRRFASLLAKAVCARMETHLERCYTCLRRLTLHSILTIAIHFTVVTEGYATIVERDGL